MAEIGASVMGMIGADKQMDAANIAGNMQLQASRESNALQSQMWDDQKNMYTQQRADLEPWRQAGTTALSGMANPDFQRDFSAADFQKDPGYDFRMQEGQKALERSAASRGGLQSGGTLKALSRYGQDYASGEYQNAYNRFNSDRDRRFGRLSSLAGLGQTANNQIAQTNAQQGQAGQNYANQWGANTMGAADAMGASKMAAANAGAAALNGMGRNWMEMQQSAMDMVGKMGMGA